MPPVITFVYAYYENPEMFKLQQSIWASYPEKIRESVEIIVTDDCSSRNPARENLISDIPLRLSLYEIKEKVEWNWLEARNIGAHYAEGKWLLLTDMDHVVTKENIKRVLSRLHGLNSKIVYQFSRIRAVDNAPYKFHNDSFFVTKKVFWSCGGYDEDYAGLYGTSGRFRDRLFASAMDHETWDDIHLVLYGREVIPDASTTEFKRKEGRDPGQLSSRDAWKRSHKRSIQTFIRPFQRVQ
jgi:hypothetical protein